MGFKRCQVAVRAVRMACAVTRRDAANLGCSSDYKGLGFRVEPQKYVK